MELVVEMAGFPLVSFTTGNNGERVFKKAVQPKKSAGSLLSIVTSSPPIF